MLQADDCSVAGKLNQFGSGSHSCAFDQILFTDFAGYGTRGADQNRYFIFLKVGPMIICGIARGCPQMCGHAFFGQIYAFIQKEDGCVFSLFLSSGCEKKCPDCPV